MFKISDVVLLWREPAVLVLRVRLSLRNNRTAIDYPRPYYSGYAMLISVTECFDELPELLVLVFILPFLAFIVNYKMFFLTP